MIDFQVKRDRFGIFESAILKSDKEDMSIWTYIILGLESEIEQWQQYLQDALDNIEDFKNGDQSVIETYTMEKLEKRKAENEERVNQLKKYIEMLSNK